MKYIVAVSGGVDSVVLLDLLSKTREHQLIVAHFDHGIRENSHEDAEFVKQLAEKYGHTFEVKREELGPQAGEALARERRYAFLQELAKKHNAQIVTAHHLDDLVETVAINFVRGTGWRGLAVFHPSIIRPLIDMPKEKLVAYAKRHSLEWREDPTNKTEAYLRNRLRGRAEFLPEDKKREIRALHAAQSELRKHIGQEIRQLVGDGPEYSRYLFIHLPAKVALEALRYVTKKKLTRPQLERLLHAIKTNPHGTKFEAGTGITAHFTTRNFTL